MILKFQKETLNAYRGPAGLHFEDGDVKEVSRDEGQRLVKDFPTMFCEATEAELKAFNAGPEEKSFDLESMTKAQICEYAEAEGLEIPDIGKLNKKDLLAAVAEAEGAE